MRVYKQKLISLHAHACKYASCSLALCQCAEYKLLSLVHNNIKLLVRCMLETGRQSSWLPYDAAPTPQHERLLVSCMLETGKQSSGLPYDVAHA